MLKVFLCVGLELMGVGEHSFPSLFSSAFCCRASELCSGCRRGMIKIHVEEKRGAEPLIWGTHVVGRA